jgi:hypothetical protein
MKNILDEHFSNVPVCSVVDPGGASKLGGGGKMSHEKELKSKNS